MPRVVDFGNCFLQLPTVVRAQQNVDIVESSVFSFGYNGQVFYPIPIEVSIFIVLYVMECFFVFSKLQAEQEEIVKRRPPTQSGLMLKEIREMDYLSKVYDILALPALFMSIFVLVHACVLLLLIWCMFCR